MPRRSDVLQPRTSIDSTLLTDFGRKASEHASSRGTSSYVNSEALLDSVRSAMKEQHNGFKHTLLNWETRQEELLFRLENMLPPLAEICQVLSRGKGSKAFADPVPVTPRSDGRDPEAVPLTKQCVMLCAGSESHACAEDMEHSLTLETEPDIEPWASSHAERNISAFARAMKPEPVLQASGDLYMPMPDTQESPQFKVSIPEEFVQKSQQSVESEMRTNPSENWAPIQSAYVDAFGEEVLSSDVNEAAAWMRSMSRDVFKLEGSRRISSRAYRTSAKASCNSVETEAMKETFSTSEQKKHNRTKTAAYMHTGLADDQLAWQKQSSMSLNLHRGYLDVVQPCFQSITQSRWFEYLSTAVIVTNALFIGLQVEYMALERTDRTPAAFLFVQVVYVVLFTVELVVRLLAEGKLWLRGENKVWNIMDVLVVVISILELGLEASSQAGVVRLIRVVRIVRIIRIIRTVRFYRALRILVYSIFGTLRQLGWTLVLLVTIMYMFGIIFTQAANDHLIQTDFATGVCIDGQDSEACTNKLVSKYYGTLARTMYSLFKTICGGLDWEGVADPLSDVHWFYVGLFITFVAFMVFAVLNVVIGVFCNSAIENAHRDQEAVIAEHIASKQLYVKNLRKLFQNMESLKYGVITLEDLEHCIQEESLSAWFAALELDVSDAWTLFKLLDTSEKNVIGVEDFVEGCLRLKGTARSIDLARMMYEVRWMMNKLVRLAEEVEKGFAKTSAGQDILATWMEHLSNAFEIAPPTRPSTYSRPSMQKDDDFIHRVLPAVRFASCRNSQ